MLTFKKDNQTKIIDPKSNLVSILKKDGWEVEGDKPKTVKKSKKKSK